MTDFFAQLEARCRGDAGVLRPRVPFRFEPVSASLAAADLTGRADAEPGWRGTPPDPPFRRPGGPGQFDEPWAGRVVRADGQPAAGPTMGGPRSAGLRPVPPAGPMRGPAADPSGRGRAAGAAVRGAGRAGHSPGRGTASATAARQEAASALDPAAVRDPVPPGAPPERQAIAWTAGPGPRAPGAARAAGQFARHEWPSGPGGDPEEADVAADAWRSGRRSQPVLRPELPGHAGRPLSVAAAGPVRRPLSAQGWARDHASGEPPGPGQESITVQVTIGRVEVRAAQPVAAAPAASRVPAGPNLADYLRDRSRSGGARP